MRGLERSVINGGLDGETLGLLDNLWAGPWREMLERTLLAGIEVPWREIDRWRLAKAPPLAIRPLWVLAALELG